MGKSAIVGMSKGLSGMAVRGAMFVKGKPMKMKKGKC